MAAERFVTQNLGEFVGGWTGETGGLGTPVNRGRVEVTGMSFLSSVVVSLSVQMGLRGWWMSGWWFFRGSLRGEVLGWLAEWAWLWIEKGGC